MKLIKNLIHWFILGLKITLTNHKIQATISVITLILISITVYKAVNLRNKEDSIEENIEKKLETSVEINYPKYNINTATGASYKVECLKSPLTEENMTTNLKNISTELENLFNSSKYNFAFKYKDLYTGFSLSYNSKQPIFAASTIKAPEAIYIYEEAEKGNIDLTNTIKYTSGYYSTGTGILKNKSFGDNYSIAKLVEYSIIYSDNAAHLMLNKKYGSNNIYNYWKNLGTTSIFKNNTVWGNINADDATIYMEELYKYYQNSNNKYQTELLSYFDKSWKIISTPNKNIRIASKSGWSGSSLHDVTLIFDENPYTLSILTNRGYVEYQNFFDKASTLIYNFHKEYWNTKYNICK